MTNLTPTGRVSKAKPTAERSKGYEAKQRARGLHRLNIWVPKTQIDQIKAFIRSINPQERT